MIDIRKTLKNKRVDITELAKRLKVSRQTVHYYINQGDKNSVDTLIKIASALDVPITELFELPEKDVIICPKCGARFRVED